ncbi:hypothetical protein QTL95_18215 [Rhizobium sp. S152]|uniref:hypothetical protein n=1 Tax=Rhizobium sp. S152 TaxID=3055038 RepID=UPI0025A9A8C5|nr:hypothetical protein [Rhizobium sp. S152]MDM9627830.1 hypothetical protein [Rhizobium sp. S152]
MKKYRPEPISHPLIYGSFCLIAFLILVAQAVEFLQTGIWKTMSLLTFFEMITEDDEFAGTAYPSMIGAALGSVPASLCFFGGSILLLIADRRRKDCVVESDGVESETRSIDD